MKKISILIFLCVLCSCDLNYQPRVYTSEFDKLNKILLLDDITTMCDDRVVYNIVDIDDIHSRMEDLYFRTGQNVCGGDYDCVMRKEKEYLGLMKEYKSKLRSLEKDENILPADYFDTKKQLEAEYMNKMVNHCKKLAKKYGKQYRASVMYELKHSYGDSYDYSEYRKK